MSKKNKLEERIMPEIFEDMRAMRLESERGCVLIAAELLNDCLKDVLVAQFTKAGLNKEVQGNLLLRFTSPFFNFGMRIMVCRAFGLLKPSICDLLDAIRAIRNHCAHNNRVTKLKDPQIKDAVQSLQNFVVKEWRLREGYPVPKWAVIWATRILWVRVDEVGLKLSGIKLPKVTQAQLRRWQKDMPPAWAQGLDGPIKKRRSGQPRSSNHSAH